MNGELPNKFAGRKVGLREVPIPAPWVSLLIGGHLHKVGFVKPQHNGTYGMEYSFFETEDSNPFTVLEQEIRLLDLPLPTGGDWE